ncbi:MAG TPA: extracellular solute-binding protein [Tepidisphaeraceae bacterium]|jgi:ABC-type Fe3+ transport system substrate-binding protein|nr:extracellular solute-binding protein [Tepidisphaeraceae bacterium]
MRRYIWIILFFIVLVAPFVVRQLVAKRADELPGANGSDALELTIVTPHNQDIRRAFAAAFSDWHQKHHGRPVRITYLTPGGTNDIVRLLNDKYDAMRKGGKLPPESDFAADIDMMWGGGDFPFDVELKPKGLLKPVNVPADVWTAAFPAPDIAGIALYEAASKDRPGAAPRWVGTALSSFGLIYSPPLYATLGLPAPTRWEELANPKLAGLVAGSDPVRSGSIAVAYLTILQRAMVDAEEALFTAQPDVKAMPKAEREKLPEYQDAIAAGWKKGMGTLQLMAANARYFTDSGSQPCNDVGNGEAAAGVAIDFFARVNEEALGRDRIRYVAPRAASAINADPIAILYGVTGEREALANRFITWLLMPETQHLWALRAGESPHVPRALRRLPIVRSVYADRSRWADDVDPFVESGGFNMRPEWTIMLFSEMRPIWSASWIDARSTLKESYRTILSVKDDALRAQLVAELADVPMEMKDVLDRRARKKLITSGEDTEETDVRIWMAKMRIATAEKFRDHYRAVAAKAEAAR